MQEGFAREFVSKVQNLRKEMDLDVSDRIAVTFRSTPEVADAVKAFHDYIANETLAVSLEPSDAVDAPESDLNGHPCALAVRKA